MAAGSMLFLLVFGVCGCSVMIAAIGGVVWVVLNERNKNRSQPTQ